MVKKCINCRSASKERLKPHSDKQWTAVKGDDPYKFCFNGSATHVKSQVLQAKQVNKWYRGSHVVISVHSRSRQIGSIVWTNLKGYSNELHFLRDTTADSWVSTEIGNFLISPRTVCCKDQMFIKRDAHSWNFHQYFKYSHVDTQNYNCPIKEGLIQWARKIPCKNNYNLKMEHKASQWREKDDKAFWVHR